MIGSFFYKNPRLLLLVIGVIVTAGLAAFNVMPRMEDPVLTRRIGLVTTTFPGADAERVESLVTQRLEEKLQDIEHIKHIQSTSASSSSVLVIELRDEVVDIDTVWSLVRDALVDVAVDLPPESTRPRLRALPLKAYAAIIALSWNRDPPANFAILRRLAENLKGSVQAIPGTEHVDLFGDPGEEVLVQVEPEILAAMDLSTGDIARQLQGSDTQRSAGLLHGERNEMMLAVQEEADSLWHLGQTPVAYGRQGRMVNLADIAAISKGIVQPPTSLATVDGQTAVVLGAFVRDEYRIDHWTERLHRTLSDFNANLSPAVSAEVIFLQNEYVGHRLRGLLKNLLMSTAAVMVVVLFAMGWRSMIVVATALPLSALMVLAGLHAMDIPIHQMSITGLIIALGLLIDNAIVIVDETRSRMWQGLGAVPAITESVNHLAMPLFGSTLTTAFAFAPIALLPGAPGEFVRSIGISVILAIFSSFFLAMTVVPALTAVLQPEATCRRTLWRYGVSNQVLSNAYKWSLQLIFRVPALGVAIGLAAPILGFMQGATLREQFFPAADREQIQIEIELAPSAPIAETQRVAEVAREIAMTDPRVKRVHWFLGQSAPTYFYNVMPRRADAAFYGQAIVELQTGVSPREVVRQLQRDLDANLRECRVIVRQLEQGPPFDAPVEIRIAGPDLATLHELGSEIRLLLSQTDQVVHTRSDLEDSLPKLALRLDPIETRLAGLSEGDVIRQLYTSVTGAEAGSLTEGTENLPIRVRFTEAKEDALAQIATAELPSSIVRGPTQPKNTNLGALAKINLASNRATIPRFDGRRVNEVKAYITAGTLPSAVVDEFERRKAEADFKLPEGYRMEFGGEASKRDEAVRNLLAGVAVLVALMVTTLVVSFRSFRVAVVIASVGGLSIGLGLLALWSFGFPLGFMAILGTMGLVGVAINDAIVVMAGIREDPEARVGNIAAMSQVIVGRTRHVVATSLTTMAGFTPLVLGGGGFWPPLAIAIAGGVGGATILALYFVPSLYLLLFGRVDRRDPTNM